MKFGGSRRRRRTVPRGDGGIDAGLVVAEGLRQHLEKGDPRSGREPRVIGENFVGKRDARGFAAAGEERLAKLDDAVGPFARRLPPLAQEGAATLGDALQHLAEERGIHRNHQSNHRVPASKS
jgi:hypothetical protein